MLGVRGGAQHTFAIQRSPCDAKSLEDYCARRCRGRDQIGPLCYIYCLGLFYSSS